MKIIIKFILQLLLIITFLVYINYGETATAQEINSGKNPVTIEGFPDTDDINQLMVYYKILKYEYKLRIHNICNANADGYKQLGFQQSHIPIDSLRNDMPPHEFESIVSKGKYTNFMQGSLRSTENPYECAIEGDGFFIISVNGTNNFTRNGAFIQSLDDSIVYRQNGGKLQGWNSFFDYDKHDYIIDSNKPLEDIKIQNFKDIPPRRTTEIQLFSNLNSEINVSKSSIFDIESTCITYDDLGKPATLYMRFKKIGKNRWSLRATHEGFGAAKIDIGNNNTSYSNAHDFVILNFTGKGILSSIENPITKTIISSGKISAVLFFIDPQNKNDIKYTFNFGYTGISENAITQFYSKIKSFTSKPNGYSSGYMKVFSINQYGVITASYSNEELVTIGQIALARFKNNQDLFSGDNIVNINNNEKNLTIGRPNQNGMGKVHSGFLETSNVRLVDEDVGLIVNKRITNSIVEILNKK